MNLAALGSSLLFIVLGLMTINVVGYVEDGEPSWLSQGGKMAVAIVALSIAFHDMIIR